MKHVLLALVFGCALYTAPAQLKTPAPSSTQTLRQDFGLSYIELSYSRPGIKGRKIFGDVVPFGKVWRTGANAATTLRTSSALQIGDLNVPAGTYTLYSLPTADGWTLIVNKQTGQWGTVYDKAQDLGRVTMSTGSNAVPVETFLIDFEKTVGQNTELHLKWAGVDASVVVTAVK